MSRYSDFKYTHKHKWMIFKLWLQHDTEVSLYRVIMHDLIKSINILLFGDKVATKIHRKYARHHNIKTDSDFAESYLDYASARYTKPDKQLDALETIQKYAPQNLARGEEHYKRVNFK